VPRTDILPGPCLTESDELDISALFHLHARTVARWAARLGGPGIDVEDVVQDVFLIARRRLTHFTGQAKITTWLFRTTERVVQGLRRKQRWIRWLARSGDQVSAHLTSLRPTPVEEMERYQATVAVYRILDRMPARYRRVIILFELEGLSTDEIAKLLGARQATVRVWLFRARAQFLAQKKSLEQPLASVGRQP
jgi:RNA polymerase sigma-70 factor (ECF subfamily)